MMATKTIHKKPKESSAQHRIADGKKLLRMNENELEKETEKALSYFENLIRKHLKR